MFSASTYKNLPSYSRVIAIAMALGVLIPSASIFWYMVEAVNNERLASHGKVRGLYESQLRTVGEDFSHAWLAHLNKISSIDTSSESAVFKTLVDLKLASSAIFLNASSASKTSIDTRHMRAWQDAQKFEFKDEDLNAAIREYQNIIASSADTSTEALALQAIARCYIKLNDYRRAFTILSEELQKTHFSDVVNNAGRSVRVNALVQALELDETFQLQSGKKQALERALISLINDYDLQSVPSKQRLFVMNRFTHLRDQFPLFEAERLASEVQLDTNEVRAMAWHAKTPSVKPLSVDRDNVRAWGVWFEEQNMLVIFTDDFFDRFLLSLVDSVENVDLVLHPVSRSDESGEELVSIPLDAISSGWRLSYHVDSEVAARSIAQARASIYVWMGVLVVLLITLILSLVYILVSRQQRLSNLKNTLMDTVTHELKTPLSSIRMFVELLLHSNNSLDAQAREYLELIDKENRRLSRLIENFLTFSRLENLADRMQIESFTAQELVSNSTSTLLDKFKAESVQFDIDIEAGLPALMGDLDLLVLLVSNLLENAYKYSEGQRVIHLGLRRHNANLMLSVKDNGIGIAKTAQHKVFDRYYRADQRLSQNVDGCGLGLNISKNIASLHKGEIKLKSERGVGSVFTVILPILEDSL